GNGCPARTPACPTALPLPPGRLPSTRTRHGWRWQRDRRRAVSGNIAPIFPGHRESPISSTFLARFATFGRRVCQFVLLVHSHYRIPNHARLIGRACIAGDLVEALVAGERGNLVGRASSFGQPPTSGLAQAVGRQAFEPDTLALLGEPLSETLGGEAAASLVRQEHHSVARRGCIDCCRQVGADRDGR